MRPPDRLSSPKSLRHQRAAALVVVLGVLVLLVALAVGILSRAGTERRASESFSAGVSARNMADVAVQFVQGQIHAATTQGIEAAWTSQPGMVRVFSSGGNLTAAYKLYSASELISSTVSLTADLPPADWMDQPAHWCDLNEPAWLAYSTGSSGNRSLVYPILDPRATLAIGDVDPVEGLTIRATNLGFNSGAPEAPDNNPAPMPVRWLYVLQDGSLVAPSGGSGKQATFSGAVVPSSANPIVGRIAFWTDDETCKVNLNTAGEGTFWDTPRLASTDEGNLGFYQPTRNEFQRYPGHPATTSLSAVFPWRGISVLDTVRRATSLSPVYRFGGSEAGTRTWTNPAGNSTDSYFSQVKKRERLYASVDELIFLDDPANSGGATRPANLLFQTNPQTARELLQSRRFVLTAHSRAPETNLFNLPRVAIWPIHRLLGTTPDPTRTTGFDRQIARSATINGEPYFFQRENAKSATNDIGIPRNQELLGYLDNLTRREIPGVGQSFDAKYGTERRQILVEIFDYIRSTNLFDELLFKSQSDRRLASVPAFTDGYPQAGTQLFYARPGHGLVIPTEYTWEGQTYRGFGRFLTVSEFGFHFICTADGAGGKPGSVPPPGSSPQSVWWLSNNATTNHTLEPDPDGIPRPRIELEANQVRVECMPVVELFNAMQGATQFSATGSIRISGLTGLRINGQPIYSNATMTVPLQSIVSTGNQPFDYFAPGGFMGFRYFAASARTIADQVVSRPVTISRDQPMVFEAQNNLTLEILDGSGAVTQTIEIAAGELSRPFPSPPSLVVTANPFVHGNFADMAQLDPTISPSALVYPEKGFTGTSPSLPAPRFWAFRNGVGAFANPSSAGISGLNTGNPQTFMNDLGRLATLGSLNPIPSSTSPDRSWTYPGLPNAPGSGAFILPNDRVHTVFPAHGDFRLIAANRSVPATLFLSGSGNNTLRDAHETGHVPGAVTQKSYGAADVLNTHFLRASDIAASYGVPQGHPSRTGDWDAGVGLSPDGPFVNKPDEGTAFRGIGNPATGIPYFASYGLMDGTFSLFFSPNRIVPSPGMFGSLSTGVVSGAPWRTLLFRPQAGHFGWQSPRDHLIMDLFWMPVVEPYAISEPFSTAGKVNLNYQIIPFTYIERSTAMRAVLKNERVSAVPDTHAQGYKVGAPGDWPANSNSTRIDAPVRGPERTRRPLDLATTLRQFQIRFDQGDVFTSGSQISEVHMVPSGESVSATTLAGFDTWANAFWSGNRLTGENLRERIYTTVYPRVTTKSNTFTVHMIVQSLRKVPGSEPTIWDDSRDKVLGEYRGSTTIERYVDPNNTEIPDYATELGGNANVRPLDDFCRWRVVQNRQFAP